MVKKIDVFDDYNKNDKIKIVFDSTIDASKGSYTKDGSVFGIYTNEYYAKHGGGYVYLDFRGWFDSNGVFVKPSSLVITVKNSSGAYLNNAFSEVIFDENGFKSRIKSDFFIWNPDDFTLDFYADTVFSKYWLTGKKIASDFFKKFKDTYGLKVEGLEDYIDDNIANTGLDVHISKSNGKVDVNYTGNHNLGGGGGGSGSIGVIDIINTDYLLGLENETLTDSFYNVIERDAFKTDSPNRAIYMAYQGAGGVFQTDEKIFSVNRDSIVVLDKATDTLTKDAATGFNNSTIYFNRNVCELDDYFVVLTQFTSPSTPGYYLIDKTTNIINKILYTNITTPGNFTNTPLFCSIREYYQSRWFDEDNITLTNGSVVWIFRTSYSAQNYPFMCLVDITTGLCYDTGSASTLSYYYWPGGALVDDSGNLYMPAKSADSTPVTNLRKYAPTSGLPYTDIALPGNFSFYRYQAHGWKFGNKLVYTGYDNNAGNLSFIVVDTTNDTISTIPITTAQTRSLNDYRITGSKYDKLKNRLYIAYHETSTTVTIGYLDIGTMTYNPTTLSLTAIPSTFPPALIKRDNNDDLIVMTNTQSSNPTLYWFYVISDDLTTIKATASNVSIPQYYLAADNFARIFDSDDNYIYTKPYGGKELIKISKSNGDVQTVGLPAKSSYYANNTQENIVVLDNDNVLIYPGFQYKDSVLSLVTDDKSMTPVKPQHVLDSASGLVMVFDGNKIYSSIGSVKSLYDNNIDLLFERVKMGDVSKLSFVKNGEQVPYID